METKNKKRSDLLEDINEILADFDTFLDSVFESPISSPETFPCVSKPIFSQADVGSKTPNEDSSERLKNFHSAKRYFCDVTAESERDTNNVIQRSQPIRRSSDHRPSQPRRNDSVVEKTSVKDEVNVIYPSLCATEAKTIPGVVGKSKETIDIGVANFDPLVTNVEGKENDELNIETKPPPSAGNIIRELNMMNSANYSPLPSNSNKMVAGPLRQSFEAKSLRPPGQSAKEKLKSNENISSLETPSERHEAVGHGQEQDCDGKQDRISTLQKLLCPMSATKFVCDSKSKPKPPKKLCKDQISNPVLTQTTLSMDFTGDERPKQGGDFGPYTLKDLPLSKPYSTQGTKSEIKTDTVKSKEKTIEPQPLPLSSTKSKPKHHQHMVVESNQLRNFDSLLRELYSSKAGTLPSLEKRNNETISSATTEPKDLSTSKGKDNGNETLCQSSRLSKSRKENPNNETPAKSEVEVVHPKFLASSKCQKLKSGVKSSTLSNSLPSFGSIPKEKKNENKMHKMVSSSSLHSQTSAKANELNDENYDFNSYLQNLLSSHSAKIAAGIMSVEHRGTKALELWTRRATDGYPGVNISNMTTSWRDGLAFCALIHHFRPDLIDFKSLKAENILENNALAFRVAEQHLGIPALLDAEDMVQTVIPDRLSILTYVSQFYQAFSALGLIGPGGRRSPMAATVTKSATNGSPATPTKPSPPFVASPKAQPISQPPATIQTKTEPQFKTDKVTVGGRGRREECVACHKTVFLAERIVVGFPGQLRHRTCFRCDRCATQLTLASYYETEKGQFCCETCPDEERSFSSGEEDSTAGGEAKLSRSSGKDPGGESSLDSESDSDSTASSESEKDSPPGSGTWREEGSMSSQTPSLRSAFLNETLEATTTPNLIPKPPRVSDSQLSPPTNFSRLSPAICGDDSVPPTESLDSDISGQFRCDDAKGQETCPPGNALDTGQQMFQNYPRKVSSDFGKLKQHSNLPIETPPLSDTKKDSLSNLDNAHSEECKVSQLKRVFESKDQDIERKLETGKYYNSVPPAEKKSPKLFRKDKTMDHAQKASLSIDYKYSPVYKRKSIEDVEPSSSTSLSSPVLESFLHKLKPESVENITKYTSNRTESIPSAPEVSNSIDKSLERSSPDTISDSLECKTPKSISINSDSCSKVSDNESSSDLVESRSPEASARNIPSPIDISKVKSELHDGEKTESIVTSTNDSKIGAATADGKNAPYAASVKEDNQKLPEPVMPEAITDAHNLVASGSPELLPTQNVPDNTSKEISAKDMFSAQPATVVSDNPFDDESEDDKESNQTVDVPSTISVNRAQDVDEENIEKGECNAEYPDELNPFGSDSEEEKQKQPNSVPVITTTAPPAEKEQEDKVSSEREVTPAKKIIKPLNPFESDDEEESRKEEEGKQNKRKSLNPFWSDEEGSENDSSFSSQVKAKVKPPRPPPPTLKRDAYLFTPPKKLILPNSPFLSKTEGNTAPPSPSLSVRSSSSDQSTLRLKKKLRHAPAPPSAESSPAKGKEPSSEGSPRRESDSLVSNQPEGQLKDDALSAKMQKDLKNHTNKMRGDAYQRDANLNSSVKNSIQMPKSERGEWRRKKGPAPSRPVPQKRAIRKLPMRQVQQELHDIEVKQTELERQGVLLETAIRDRTERGSTGSASPEDSNSYQSISTSSEAEKSCSSITSSSSSPQGIEVEDMILQLFELVNEKNELFRRQTELMYMKREKRLEEEYAELEYQIRCLMLKPSSERNEEDTKQEEDLIARLVKVVEQRDAVVNCLEMERQREAIEDESIASHMIKYQEKHIEGIESDGNKEHTKKKKKKLRLLRKKKKGKEKEREKVSKIDADKDVDETEMKKKKKKKNWFKKSGDVPEHKT